MRGDLLDVVGLLREIELLEDHAPDLRVVRLEPADPRDELHDAEDAANRGKIEPHDAVDVRMLHLDRDPPSIRQPRPVYLCERRTRNRYALELGEQFAWRL